MPATGDKPGKGIYVCDYCGSEVVLDKPTDVLPPCPKCNRKSFHRAK